MPATCTVKDRSVLHAKDAICAVVAELCREQMRSNFRALILTGSFARNEGTIRVGKEQIDVLGDADFLVVANRPERKHPDVSEDLLARKAERILAQQGIACKIGLGAVTTGYFSRLTPHILGFELKHSGQVVAGDSTILSLIPSFDAKDIPQHDAWCLLCNRITEQLEVARELSCERDVLSEGVVYGFVKLYLDMATSLLVFLGAYKPIYFQRCRELLRLAQEHSTPLPFDLAEFADYVRTCTELKLNWSGWQSKIDAATCWKAIEYALSLWNWERDQLNGFSKNYQRRHGLAPEPLTRIVRGWASALRRQSWRDNRGNAVRWFRLALQGSPRNHIYSASTRLFFKLHSLLSDNLSADQSGELTDCRRHLPLLSKGNPESWRELAGEVSKNYRELLITTRS